ncbi:MAG: HAMP domain-containing histidine kinase [Chitinophaga sp.]|uniref:HAMP domain-containing sensor histidine kinase n=1 Tax=Chitinophaga sp. TaxID=1869181 RepID=UPI001B162671|nr:HAMP domain-containing sensor histidine kinase [Chitinophaga sp.]MBO9729780.1 HAMP domain-containing histidine kinase [Chitinophaga sp.]
MQLQVKLTLFITLSKMAVAALFILLLPRLIEDIAFKYNDYYLHEQEKKVLLAIRNNGIETYLQGEDNYGSYTMLKEEYISLEPATSHYAGDTIETVKRIVEKDTLTYRVLSHQLHANGKDYMMEIGRKYTTISQYNRPLQRMALYVLGALISITIITDLVFTRYLLKPLGKIIRTRLFRSNFPFKEQGPPVNTTTADFKYLDNSLVALMNQINVAFEKEREFTSNASHELMTPVSILQHKLENFLADGNLEDEAQSKIISMMSTLNRLKKIVHSLLLISRIENEQFPRQDNVRLNTLVHQVVEELEHRTAAKNLDVKIELTATVVLRQLNQDLIFQMIYNLLNNAIKFNTTNGSIHIKEYLTRDTYHLIIQDTGIGMPAADLENIFHRFRKHSHRNNDGYGLGLSIVKTIADFHDILIKVSSTPGEGSTFTLVFNLRSQKASA